MYYSRDTGVDDGPLPPPGESSEVIEVPINRQLSIIINIYILYNYRLIGIK